MVSWLQIGATPRVGVIAALFVVASTGCHAAAQALEGPAHENKIAAASLYAPEDLTVVDPVRTAARFAAAGERVPVVTRIDAGADEAVVAQLTAAFRHTRDRFKARLESEFGAPQLSLRQINSSRFRVVVDDFQAGNALFPVNSVLAQSWAKGYDGEPTVERLARAVRDLMRIHPISDMKPADSVWLVSLGPSTAIASWNEVAPHARVAEPGRILDRQTAGAQLRRNLDAIDRSAGGFVSGLLRETLIPDSYLTGLLLADRYGTRVETRRFAAGDLLVDKGDTIDRWAALAIESIDRRGLRPASPGRPAGVVSRIEPSPTGTDVARAPTSTVGAPLTPGHVSSEPSGGRMLRATLAFMIIAGLGAGVWWIRRSGLQPPQWLIPGPRPADTSMREAMLPHLARELKGRLVQVLFAQRNALLENEAVATRRVEELEARLARLQPAIAEKIRTYERRIRVLESEIEEKDQETRDLLRAKLVLARKELNDEIARNRLN